MDPNQTNDPMNPGTPTDPTQDAPTSDDSGTGDAPAGDQGTTVPPTGGTDVPAEGTGEETPAETPNGDTGTV